MIIGCVREVKDDEYRVGINPESAKAYLAAGHTVLIETNAGVGSGFTDEKYQEIGCHIIETAQEVWEKAEMMIKVKEPAKSEYELLKENSILYTYLHLAADKELTQKMVEKKVIGVAYETVQYPGEDLPLLKPMSMIAGRLATQQGAKYLEKTYGGKGMLLSGLIGSQPSDVVIVGSGNVATGAILLAYGMGANVHVVSTDAKQLEAISASYPDRLTIHKSTRENIEKLIVNADLIILSALVAGAKAPTIITRDMLKMMEPGTVIVDVAVDQGGNSETTHPTTHHDPIYIIDDVVHYCVSNMPGAVPRTATLALNHATLKFGLEIANKGIVQAAKDDKAIYNGVNTYDGHIVYEGVATAHNLEFVELDSLI